MNNSLERLLGGIVTALRVDIVPRLEDEYAAGQALAIIDLLQSLSVHLDWAVGPLLDKWRAQKQLFRQLDALLGDGAGHPLLSPEGMAPSTGFELMAACNAMDAHLAQIVRGLGGRSEADQRRQEALGLIRAHLKLDLERDLSLTPRPLFAEISRGRASAQPAIQA
jgi:hypothetical protein